jgi:PAS domain S-box-containing protein
LISRQAATLTAGTEPAGDEALIENEERLRLAAEAARLGSWDWDIRTGAVHLSDKLMAFHGIEPGAFGGRYEDYLECIHPDDRDAFGRAIAVAIQDATDLDIEYRIVVPGGGIRWMAGTGRVRYDAESNALRMVGMGMEITQRKRDEEALRFLSDSSKLLAESLDYERVLERIARLVVPTLADWCAVDLIDDEGEVQRLVVTHADPAKRAIAEKLKSFVPTAEKSAPVVDVLRSGRSILTPTLPDEVLVAAAVNAEHLQIMRALRFSSVMIVPLYTRERTLGALTLMIGESRRRYDEHDLALAEDLARRAALAIDNADLYRESQRNAERLQQANSAKDEFLGLVSHELRTPLTAIFGYAQLLRRRAASIGTEEREEALAELEQQTDRLHRVVENLLMLSRVDAGATMELEPVLVQHIVRRVAAEALAQSQQRCIDVRCESSVGPVLAQPVYVEQIIGNLLSNAAKYSPPEAPIEVVIEPGWGHDVAVRVLDRGIGIKAEEADRLFEPFYRSRSTTGLASGAGVGLAVCRRLVEEQDGRIWAQPRPDGGSEVGFSLPLYRD